MKKQYIEIAMYDQTIQQQETATLPKSLREHTSSLS